MPKKNGNQVATWENERISIFLGRQKEQIFAEGRTEIQKHEYSDRSIQELNGIIESQRRQIDHTNASDEQLRRDQVLLQEQLSNKIGIFVELISKVFIWEELKRVQGSRIDREED